MGHICLCYTIIYFYTLEILLLLDLYILVNEIYLIQILISLSNLVLLLSNSLRLHQYISFLCFLHHIFYLYILLLIAIGLRYFYLSILCSVHFLIYFYFLLCDFLREYTHLDSQDNAKSIEKVNQFLG